MSVSGKTASVDMTKRNFDDFDCIMQMDSGLNIGLHSLACHIARSVHMHVDILFNAQ